MSKVLVTGGLGYIGSHTCVELLDNGYDVIVVDNLYNSKIDVVDKIKTITGKDITFYKIDVTDKEKLREVFEKEDFDAVLHFAAYKAVGESVQKPLKYYRNNLDNTLTLLELMEEYKVNKFIFSSSATVYGDPEKLPITEDMKVGGTTNPYGTTKYFIERILTDVGIANKEFKAIALRYFNPVGAHSSGLIGEDPNGIPNNLMPYIVKVATGELECLTVFGNDYDTDDGSGVRDYIHVVDLAKGHVVALSNMDSINGVEFFNLGTGCGYSVLDMVNTFEKVNGLKVNYKIGPRRDGDIASCYADSTKALKRFNWKAEKTLDDMQKDAYNFVKNNKK